MHPSRHRGLWRHGLALLWLAMCQCVVAVTTIPPYWTITSYVIQSFSTDVFSGMYETKTYGTYTRTYEVKKGATPTLPAVSSTSTTYVNMLVVSVFLPPGAVPEQDIIKTHTYATTSTPLTYFRQPVYYTPPSSCHTTSVYTTDKEVQIPLDARDQVTPTSKTTSIPTNSADYTVVTAYLTPNAVSTVTAATTDNVYIRYVGHCRDPAKDDPYFESHSGGGGGGSSSGGSHYTVVVILSPRAIAGIAIGVVAFVALIGAIIYKFFACCGCRKPPKEPETTTVTFLPPTGTAQPVYAKGAEDSAAPPAHVREVA